MAVARVRPTVERAIAVACTDEREGGDDGGEDGGEIGRHFSGWADSCYDGGDVRAGFCRCEL